MVAGVTYVNDSKATNVEATLTALNAYPEGTHLILGGRDKASDYRPVARACARGCQAVYLIGEATPLIAEAFAEVRPRGGSGDATPVPLGVRRPGEGRAHGGGRAPCRAMWCCWRRPAPASTSTPASKSGASTSRRWSRTLMEVTR